MGSGSGMLLSKGSIWDREQGDQRILGYSLTTELNTEYPQVFSSQLQLNTEYFEVFSSHLEVNMNT